MFGACSISRQSKQPRNRTIQEASKELHIKLSSNIANFKIIAEQYQQRSATVALCNGNGSMASRLVSS